MPLIDKHQSTICSSDGVTLFFSSSDGRMSFVIHKVIHIVIQRNLDTWKLLIEVVIFTLFIYQVIFLQLIHNKRLSLNHLS